MTSYLLTCLQLDHITDATQKQAYGVVRIVLDVIFLHQLMIIKGLNEKIW